MDSMTVLRKMAVRNVVNSIHPLPLKSSLLTEVLLGAKDTYYLKRQYNAVK